MAEASFPYSRLRYWLMSTTGERRRSRHSARQRLAVSKLELIIVGVGLVASVVAGVVAYQIVGPYDDGPFSIGYRRVLDPETGKSLLVHETRTDKGVVRRVINGQTLKEVRLDVNADERKTAGKNSHQHDRRLEQRQAP